MGDIMAMVMVITDISDMATDITDMVIIMDIIWVRDPPMLNQLPKLPLPQKPLLKPKPHLGTDTVTDTTVMVMDTDITDMDTDILMVIMDIIWANDPLNLPLKLMPPQHLTTDTDTDTTVMDTDTDTTDIPTITDKLTTTANNKATTPLNNATTFIMAYLVVL